MDFTFDKEFFGALSVALGLWASASYFYGLWKYKFRPHFFSWFIWTLLTGIALAAQIYDSAGAGSWVMALTAASCGVVTILALFIGEKKITRGDWIAFLAALMAIPVWVATNNPLYAVILVTAIDALGFYPTFRKSWVDPYSDSAFSFSLHAIKFIPSIFAMEKISAVNLTYPLALVALNGGFAVMLLARRNVIKQNRVAS